MVGFEPTTPALRKRCSTVELHRRSNPNPTFRLRPDKASRGAGRAANCPPGAAAGDYTGRSLSTRPWAVCMDLVAAAEQGFETVDADPVFKRQAVEFLRKWLSGPEFAPYRPQIEWQISSAKWADLLDAFYQVLPFGTGGRRGGVGIGPNRMNLWTLGASVQGHCEYLKARFPGVTDL